MIPWLGWPNWSAVWLRGLEGALLFLPCLRVGQSMGKTFAGMMGTDWMYHRPLLLRITFWLHLDLTGPDRLKLPLITLLVSVSLLSLSYYNTTSKVPSPLGSSEKLRHQIWLWFMPKPKVTMRYFCIIPKTKNRMGINVPPHSTYMQSFNFWCNNNNKTTICKAP